MNLYLVARWKEGVKTNNQFWMSLEQVWNTTDDTRSVDTKEKNKYRDSSSILAFTIYQVYNIFQVCFAYFYFIRIF